MNWYRPRMPSVPLRFEVFELLDTPQRSLALNEEESDEHSRRLHASIPRNRDLLLKGWDYGDTVRQISNRDQFQYRLSVPRQFTDTVLLDLLKERFNSVHEARLWLVYRRIPCKFKVWGSDEEEPS